MLRTGEQRIKADIAAIVDKQHETFTPQNEPPGCGLQKYFMTGPDDPFDAACKWHDHAYDTGQIDGQEATKLRVDCRFHLMMMEVAEQEKNPLKRLWLYGRAETFYHLVREFSPIEHFNGEPE